VKQLLPLHWKGAQTFEFPATQAPLPSHSETAWCSAMLQVSGAHWVPEA
jgi:hypothetical protein